MIGERNGSQQFPVRGRIDEVAFWSRGLGNEEVAKLYNNGNGFEVIAAPEILVADVNQDGVMNLLDVAPFVERITTGEYQAEADVNQDCIVNLLDVGPFIDELSGS